MKEEVWTCAYPTANTVAIHVLDNTASGGFTCYVTAPAPVCILIIQCHTLAEFKYPIKGYNQLFCQDKAIKSLFFSRVLFNWLYHELALIALSWQMPSCLPQGLQPSVFSLLLFNTLHSFIHSFIHPSIHSQSTPGLYSHCLCLAVREPHGRTQCLDLPICHCKSHGVIGAAMVALSCVALGLSLIMLAPRGQMSKSTSQ